MLKEKRATIIIVPVESEPGKYRAVVSLPCRPLDVPDEKGTLAQMTAKKGKFIVSWSVWAMAVAGCAKCQKDCRLSGQK